jgi:ComF family protein
MNALLERAQTILVFCMDTIMPMRERSARTKDRSPEDFVLAPTAHELLGVKITTLMDYRDDATLDLIQSLKYDRSAYAASIAAKLLEEYLLEEIASHKQFSQKKILLVPIPLHESRAKERGFNQIELVLQALPATFKDGTIATLAPNTLLRTRATKPQTRLHRTERLSNVAGAFDLSDPALVGNANIFLIDDVTTTGATLANAANPLRRAGATVSLLALARA